MISDKWRQASLMELWLDTLATLVYLTRGGIHSFKIIGGWSVQKKNNIKGLDYAFDKLT